MKAGWESKAFAEVLDIRNGRNQREVQVDDGPYPILGSAGKVMGYASDYICEAGTTIIGRKGTIDNPIFATTRFWNVDTAFGLAPKSSLDPKYLHYFCLGYNFTQHDRGTTLPSLVKTDLLQIAIPIPPLDEQRRIVAVLDKAFAAIAIATDNAQQNLTNARALFESYLQSTFSTDGPDGLAPAAKRPSAERSKFAAHDEISTRTGGRSATTRAIQGRRALGVGPQTSMPKTGWLWRRLDEVAQLHSGHTPSRKLPEYWGGDVPWVSIRDAKRCHGSKINETLECTNDLGIANSSARILPAGTVCLSRTASVGYVAILAKPMATSQDFINWVCSGEIDPEFLQFLFMAQGQDIFRFSSGAVHQTIYYPEAKAFHICFPDIGEQQSIVKFATQLRRASQQLAEIHEAKLVALAELKQSLLEKAFAGEITAIIGAAQNVNDNFATPQFTAQVIAFAHRRHELRQRERTFGHVKAQKTLHLVECVGGIDLGREPIRDAAGPNDFQHMLRATDWAVQQGFFEFVPRATGNGYDFRKLANYNACWADAEAAVQPVETAIARAIDLIVDSDSTFAELIATTHAAWNNLIRDQAEITDDAIVQAARDNWHTSKLQHDPSRFHDAIRFIRTNAIIPDGTAKYVSGQGSLF